MKEDLKVQEKSAIKTSRGIVAQIAIVLLATIIIVGFLIFKLIGQFKQNPTQAVLPTPTSVVSQDANLQKMNTDLEDLKKSISNLDKQSGNDQE